MNNNKKPSLIYGVAGAMIIMTLAVVAPLAATTQAQAQLSQPQQPQQQSEMFESEDGFGLQIPAGWVIEDFENIPEESDSNLESIAMLCLESEALPALRGESTCLGANLTDSIYIYSWPDLQSMSEFQDIPEPPTVDDLVALRIQYMQNSNLTSDIQIVNSTDIGEFRKIVNMTYIAHYDGGTWLDPFDDTSYPVKSLQMFALNPDNGTGYAFVNTKPLEHEIQTLTQHNPGVQQVFNSFEIVR